MFVYGFLVSAPLGHLLLSLQQRAFAGRTGARAKFAQILSSNLIIAPIQVTGARRRPLAAL
jgi:peroxisomal membrane protein 2